MSGMALLRCICDETRFAILQTLADGEMAVGDIVEAIGREQPLVSYHLRILRECGILGCRADGRRSLYGISDPKIAALITNITEAGNHIGRLCEQSCNTMVKD